MVIKTNQLLSELHHTSPKLAGIFKQIINYWLGCFQTNKTTLIFTNAWDQVDFESKYENYFDNYSLGGTHHIATILVSSKDLSLVYSK